MNFKNNVKAVVPLYYSVPLLAICLVVLGLLILLFRLENPVVLFAPPATAINVGVCGSLDTNGAYYLVNDNLTFLGIDCLTIVGNDTVLDGQHSYNLTGDNTLGTSAVVVIGNNVTVLGLNITYANTGVLVKGANVSVVDNFINLSDFAGIRLQNSIGSYVANNTIRPAQGAGIFVDTSFLALIENNTILSRTVADGGSAGGVGLVLSNNVSVLRNNIINGQYGLATISSNGNAFYYNTIQSSSEKALFLQSVVGQRSTFSHNRIFGSLKDAIIMDVVKNVLFINNSVVGTSASYYDINVVNPQNSFEIVDGYLGNYSLLNTSLVLRSTGFGAINFTSPLTAIGNNLTKDVRVTFNNAEVDSSVLGLNRSAIVSLEGLSTSFTNPVIYRNGLVCPSSVCVPLTSLNSGIVMFSVSGWTNYSIGNGPIGPPYLSIQEPDNNEVYSLANFPVGFIIDLSQNGTAWFSLDEGSTNVSMNTTNNIRFTYNQSSLSIGNYTFRAYANFTGNEFKDNRSVNFSVISTLVIGNNSSGNRSSQGNAIPILPPPVNRTVQLNNTASGSQSSKSSSLEFKYIAYWLVISIISILIIILIFLIVKAIQSRKIEQNTIPGSIVSQLR